MAVDPVAVEAFMKTIRYGTGMSEYTCPRCGSTALRAGRFIPVDESERSYRGEERRLPEICGELTDDPDHPYEHCLAEMVWTPTQSATDLLGEHFVIDIGQGPQKISSMRELRTIESNSLRKAANGEGAPVNFRGFSQDRSNRDVNSLRGSSYEKNRQIPVNRRTQSGQPITGRTRSKFDGSE